jgi:hypothetical protein
LYEITVPASVEVLDVDSFSSCSSLSLVIFESRSRLREVGQNAFSSVTIRPILPQRNASFDE